MPKKRSNSDSASQNYSRSLRKRPRSASDSLVREDSVFSAKTDHSENTTAANLIRAHEILESYHPDASRDHDDIMQPALRAFLDFLPDDGRHQIVKDINNAGDNHQSLYDIFNNLYTGLISRMLARPKQPVTPSPNPRREQHSEVLSTSIHSPITRQEIFSKNLLKRDGYKCVVTGHYDERRYKELKLRAPELNPTVVVGAHIIPFSYGTWSPNQRLPSDVQRSWEVLFICFPAIRDMRFEYTNLNDLVNGFTLTEWVHSCFGRFQLAFKATDIPHQYQIEVLEQIGPAYRAMLPDKVTFKNHDPEESYELPSPALLDCHYRLYRILHASGMAEAFEDDFHKWEKEKETVHGLTEDGTTDIAEVLRFAFPYTAVPA